MIIHQLLLTVYKNNFILSLRCGIYIIYMIKNHAYKVFSYLSSLYRIWMWWYRL